jgi:hypothetical protein
MDLLFNVSIFFKRTLNWRLVRGVAELQILTKATYFMLVFVPILAGTWPAVKLYVNSHNKAVVEATEILETSAIEFNNSRELLENYINKNQPENKLLTSTIEELNIGSERFLKDVRNFTNDFLPKTIEKSSLPWTWAAAFFASLFAVIAHLIYQLASPDILRNFTFEEFVKDKKEDYSSHPSEESLKRAQSYLSTKEGEKESEIERHRAIRSYEKLISELNENKNRTNAIPSIDIATNLSLSQLVAIQNFITQDPTSHNNSLEILELVKNAYDIKSEKVGGRDIEKHKNMTIIEKGARAEYLHWAGRNLLMAFITTAIYAISIIIIFEIIYLQSSNVIQMAGWSGLSDLFKVPVKL